MTGARSPPSEFIVKTPRNFSDCDNQLSNRLLSIMDIHRCRFVPFPPSTINALAFSHSHIPKDQKTATPRLAVGRANGDIEIWNPLKGSWVQETIIQGGKDRSIDGLVWTQDPDEEVEGKKFIGRLRLFSIGYTTTVTEWDLAKGRPLRQASGNHGEIWCIAAQPSLSPTEAATNGNTATQWLGQSLITGCTDGALVLYSTKDDDLLLQKILVRPSSKKAKIISITFQDRNIVVAGCSDSVVRIFDIRSGSLLRSMSTGAGPKGGPKEVIIWSVKVLRDGTIISGDSTGELKIWDGKTYTLRQRIQSHRQDILSLAVSHDGSAIFSGGMDRRTVAYKPTGKGKTRWAEVGHRRFHIHDVKTMASFEAPGISVVVSGGPDASPTVVPLGKYGFELQRALPFLPQEPNIMSSPKARLMMSWWDREIRVWRVSHSTEEKQDDAPEGRKLVAKILVKGEANITSASLSTDGNILAVSTITDLKIFLLQSNVDGTICISKVPLSQTLTAGARLVRFSPDTKWLCIVRPDSHITLARILTSTSASSTTITFYPKLTKLDRLDRHISKLVRLGGLGSYDRIITQLAFSSDSRMLAVSDLSGYIDTFLLSGNEEATKSLLDDESDAASSSSSSQSGVDSDDEEKEAILILGQHWTRNPLASSLPKLPASIVALSFRPSVSSSPEVTNGVTPPATRNTPHPISHELPSGEDRLLAVTATSAVYEFSVLQGSLSNWSRRNPPTIFPDEFRKTLETVRGIIWDVSEARERVWLWSVGWLWMFDLRKNFSLKEDENKVALMSPARKRKRGGKEHPSGAGGHAKRYELGLGIGRAIKKTIFNNEMRKNEVNEQVYLFEDKEDPMDLDDDKVDSTVTLQHLRNPEQDSELEEQSNSDGERRQGDWHTFKYRPILGVVVIGEDQQDGGPEVAIVERPIWEVDLPPRYYGEQEWRDKETSFDG